MVVVVNRKMAKRSAEHFTRFTTTSAIWSLFADLNSPLSSLRAHQGELNIEEGKHVLACFKTRNYFE